MNNFKFETISADVRKADLMNFSVTSHLNEMYKRFYQKLLDNINKNAPKKTMSHKTTVSWKFGHCSASASLKIWWIITHEH